MESSWDLHWIPQLFDGLQREWNLVSDKIIQHYDKYIDKTDRLNLLGPFNIENKMIISKSWHSCDGSCCILPTVETDKGKSLLETGWDYWTMLSFSSMSTVFKKRKRKHTHTQQLILKKNIYKNDNNKVKHSIFTFTGTLDRQHVCVFSYEQKTKHCSQFISYTVLERGLLRNCCWHFIKSNVRFITDLRLSRVLVLGQIDPWDWAKWSEELLQVCLTGVLRQVGDTNGSIVISCQKQTVFLLNNTWGCAGIINHNTTTITPSTSF